MCVRSWCVGNMQLFDQSWLHFEVRPSYYQLTILLRCHAVRKYITVSPIQHNQQRQNSQGGKSIPQSWKPSTKIIYHIRKIKTQLQRKVWQKYSNCPERKQFSCLGYIPSLIPPSSNLPSPHVAPTSRPLNGTPRLDGIVHMCLIRWLLHFLEFYAAKCYFILWTLPLNYIFSIDQ